MVVIKGVQMFHNNASVEYSDLEVMQMLGRAVCDRNILYDFLTFISASGASPIW
jgi:hypothetical protein